MYFLMKIKGFNIKHLEDGYVQRLRFLDSFYYKYGRFTYELLFNEISIDTKVELTYTTLLPPVTYQKPFSNTREETLFSLLLSFA